MKGIELRAQRISDAKRFFEILNCDEFVFIAFKPKTIKEEKEWIKKNKKRKGFSDNYSIVHKGKVIGGAGIKIDQHRKYIGEIGYFVDIEHHNKGVATTAVKILEKIGFEKHKLKRIEIRVDKKNLASQKVATKAGYKKEGILRKAFIRRGKAFDQILYAKTK